LHAARIRAKVSDLRFTARRSLVFLKGNHVNISYLSELTENQYSAVSHMEGPMLVLAGPGSGKTRVIIYRIAHLIKHGIAPNEILAVTFTNKAAEEMRSRLRSMDIAGGSTLCTFHSLCARLLMEFGSQSDLAENFSIYDRSEQKSILNQVFKSLDLDPKQHAPEKFLRHIGRLKNRLVSPHETPNEAFSGISPALFQKIYTDYQNHLTNAGALDFDDLLMKTALLLRRNPSLRSLLGNRYRYILVDEYQDTNPCQYGIARSLANSHRNLFVTGDPDQAIYGWRGADLSNILTFEKDFPEARIVRLEQNFRSTPQVLRLADNLIRANTQRKKKRLHTQNPEGFPPRLYRFSDEYEEAQGVSAWIQWMVRDFDLDYGNIAVFYRTNAMSRIIENALQRKQIPYRIIKGLEFFQRREIKDMLAYLRLLINPADDAALLRIINRPARGIGDRTIERLTRHARLNQSTLWSQLENIEDIPDIPSVAIPRIRQFISMITDLRHRLDDPVASLMETTYRLSGFKSAHQNEGNDDALDNINELIRSAQEFSPTESEVGGLAGYLQKTALVSDSDAYRNESGSVSLMTLHAAKGLEFSAAMIVGVEDGIIPHSRSKSHLTGLEEERRLLFVGITRAKQFLALSHTQTRTVNGMSRPSRLSPFMNNSIDIEVIQAPFYNHGFETPSSITPHSNAFSRCEKESVFQIGQNVRHPSIGLGRIEGIMPDGENSRVVVRFDSGPRLTLSLRQARLEPAEG